MCHFVCTFVALFNKIIVDGLVALIKSCSASWWRRCYSRLRSTAAATLIKYSLSSSPLSHRYVTKSSMGPVVQLIKRWTSWRLLLLCYSSNCPCLNYNRTYCSYVRMCPGSKNTMVSHEKVPWYFGAVLFTMVYHGKKHHPKIPWYFSLWSLCNGRKYWCMVYHGITCAMLYHVPWYTMVKSTA